MRIIVDAMGGDNAPKAIVEGVLAAAAEWSNISLTLVGREAEIKKHIQTMPKNVDIVNADEVIDGCDIPTQAVRQKKNSSLIVGLNLVKEGKGDAFLSAGNTGALLAGSFRVLGRIKGVTRPALTPLMPSKTGPVMIVDAGANLECKPINLLQFGIMGYIYMQKVIERKNPKVGLINVGTEESKGLKLYKDAAELMRKSDLNFVGNVEARQIAFGDADVFVCDGFVGNAVLKMMEGAGLFIMSSVKNVFMSSFKGKIAALMVKDKLKEFKNQLDYKEYGGAPLLGIDGVVVKAHGSSDARAIRSAVRAAERFAATGVNEEIYKQLSLLSNIEEDME